MTTSKQKPHICAILVAAGRGARAGGLEDGPKQYRMIGDKAVLAHSLQPFLDHPDIDHVMIAHHEDDAELLDQALEGINRAQVTTKITTCLGANNRQGSVYQGLKWFYEHSQKQDVPQPDYILIHDGVRPFVTEGLLSRAIDALISGDTAVLPALPVSSTLKQADDAGYIQATIPREQLYAAQTPQAFAFEPIFNAHSKAEQAGKYDFTDDCAIAEWSGMEVKIIAGEAANIKLTTRDDIAIADEKLQQAFAPKEENAMIDVRTGNGYDVHQLVPGDGVILCGIKIPHDKKLEGHSDADVAFHALTDALLATCGAGDIGDHFPPTDPQWKGASSDIFLKKAVELVTKHGGTITNADISIIAEQPKIGPHRQNLRDNLAKILAIDLERCSIKATTNEKIGFIGREEGIAAIATATVVYG